MTGIGDIIDHLRFMPCYVEGNRKKTQPRVRDIIYVMRLKHLALTALRDAAILRASTFSLP